MRPSEALALSWGDVNINRQQISISKSRYLGFEAATKTAASEREIKIVAQVAEALKAIKLLMAHRVGPPRAHPSCP